MGCGKRTSFAGNRIDINVWFDHFKDVFAIKDPNESQHEFEPFVLNEEADHELNVEISEGEVQRAIINLKRGKACGVDSIAAEMLKAGGKVVYTFLTKLFNSIFDQGVYPLEWAKAIIIPIHKKGDTQNADNYRGVSLLSIVSKCYTSVLNNRLYCWLEENKIIQEGQAGFRKTYSTTDQIFTLFSIVQKCMSKKHQKLYVAFVDFKKAFDSVRHEKLLECIRNHGVKGKFFCTLRAIYSSLLSCVRVNGEYSQFFECPVGVRQGCVLSPTLFSLFINQLANHISVEGRHGIQLLPDLLELFILLFADDVALLSMTPIGLQNQLDCLKNCCDEMKLCVNTEKTKIMVFRKGGFLSKHEKWFYDGAKMEVVNEYCYLGFKFTTMISCNIGTEHLVTKGKKAVGCLNRAFQRYNEMSYETFFKIFDAKVQPILLYASEIWGFNKLDSVERVHLKACKRYLGVPIITPNKMVYGDLKRFPLYINAYVRSIRYWFRLLQMDPHRIPQNAYRMLLSLDENGKECWVSQLRQVLCESGFNVVWLHQGVGDVRMFVNVFKQRLVDMFTQEWSGSLRNSNRYDVYRSFKTVFEREKYLTAFQATYFRAAVTQVRFGVLPINNNLHRYSIAPEDRNCPFCISETENEIHVIFECPMYNDIRIKFLKDSSNLPLQLLLEARVDRHINNLAKFVFHTVKKRNRILMSELQQ